jgi:hypothetical protein
MKSDTQQRMAPTLRPLFCDPCGCGLCAGERGEENSDESDGESAKPAWLRCRDGECGSCGLAVVYPACPTVAGLPSVTFRVLESSRAYIAWLVAGEVGAEPARSKTGPADLLVRVVAPGHVFRRYVDEQMARWGKHAYVEVSGDFVCVCSHRRQEHQLLARNRSIAALMAAPPGERLEVRYRCALPSDRLLGAD